MRVKNKEKNKENIRVKQNVASAMAKVQIESEYYLNLEREDKKRYREKLTLSNGERLPDPSVLDVEWKGEVQHLPELLQTFLII